MRWGATKLPGLVDVRYRFRPVDKRRRSSMRYPRKLFPTRSFRTATACSIYALLVAVPLATAAMPPARRSPVQSERALTPLVQDWMLGAPLPGARWGAA